MVEQIKATTCVVRIMQQTACGGCAVKHLCKSSESKEKIVENAWVIEPGEYEIMIGASSTDIRLSAKLEKSGDPVENPYADDIFKPYCPARSPMHFP